jgi:hypothetical protein
MSHRVFRSPSSVSAAAAAAPSRIAAEVAGAARWRQLPGGQIEVATLTDDGRLARVQVEHDGTTTPVDFTPQPRRLWARPTMILGIVLFIGTAVLLDSEDPNPFGILIVFIGFALIPIGAIAQHNTGDIDARLKKEYGKDAGWNEPTNLHGWTPRTAEQLRTVEQLADEHEGVAFVRELGGRTIDVYTRRRGRFEHYWVGEDGAAELVDVTSMRGRYVLERTLALLCGAFFFAGFIGAIVLDDHKGLLVLIALTGVAATMVAGGLIGHSMSVARRIRRERSAGGSWHEIRTWIEEDDGG